MPARRPPPALAAAISALLLGATLLLAPTLTASAQVRAPDDDPSEAVLSAHPGDRAKAVLTRAEQAIADESADPKAAVAALDQVLASDDLSDRTRARALALRAMLKDMRLGDQAGALADFDEAIAYDPANPVWYSLRGGLRETLDNPTGASFDYSHAEALDRGNAEALRGRGRVNLGLGRYEVAAGDLATALKAEPQTPYLVLELHLARAFAHVDDKAELTANAAAAGVAPGDWPSPVYAYYQGRLSADGLLAATRTSTDIDPSTNRPRPAALRRCEAAYYIGMELMAKGKTAAARPLLKEAETTCPRGYTERSGAHAALLLIDRPPAPTPAPATSTKP